MFAGRGTKYEKNPEILYFELAFRQWPTILKSVADKKPQFDAAPWCNGSTSDSGSFSWGSNPCGAAIFFALLKLLSFKRVFYPVRQMIGAHLGHKWGTNGSQSRICGDTINVVYDAQRENALFQIPDSSEVLTPDGSQWNTAPCPNFWFAKSIYGM